MEWNLQPVLNCDGKRMPMEVSLSLVPNPKDDFRVIGDVTLRGEVVNIGGCLEVTATGSATLERTCDRCAEVFQQEVQFPIEERIKKADASEQETEDQDAIILEGTSIDLSELVYAGLYMNLPSKALCREDCKGICSVCGQNRNLADCSCDDRPVDPRFDVLDQLL